MQYASYAYSPQSQHPCHAPSIMMVQHTPHPCVYPPGAMMPQHTGQHPLCMELERVLCMILARAPYDEGCCKNAVQVCQAYELKIMAGCVQTYVHPGCALTDNDNPHKKRISAMDLFGLDDDNMKKITDIVFSNRPFDVTRYLRKFSEVPSRDHFEFRDNHPILNEVIRLLRKLHAPIAGLTDHMSNFEPISGKKFLSKMKKMDKLGKDQGNWIDRVCMLYSLTDITNEFLKSINHSADDDNTRATYWIPRHFPRKLQDVVMAFPKRGDESATIDKYDDSVRYDPHEKDSTWSRTKIINLALQLDPLYSASTRITDWQTFEKDYKDAFEFVLELLKDLKYYTVQRTETQFENYETEIFQLFESKTVNGQKYPIYLKDLIEETEQVIKHSNDVLLKLDEIFKQKFFDDFKSMFKTSTKKKRH